MSSKVKVESISHGGKVSFRTTLDKPWHHFEMLTGTLSFDLEFDLSGQM